MNAKLAAGGAILIALTVLALFPSLVAPFPRDYSDTLRYIDTPAGREWRYAPEAPSDHYPWGTDKYGYDMLTRLAWGLRWTLASVAFTAFLRTVLGGGIGVMRALLRFGERHDRGFTPLAGIPSFVMVFFVIFPVTINSPLNSAGLFLYQCLAMTVFNLGGPIAAMSAKAALVLRSSFVEAAVSAGAGKRWILARHLMPYLAEEFWELFAEQTVDVLKMVGRLGIFFLFIGGTTRSYDPPILTSTKGEVAGLIGLYRARLMSSRWLLAYPLTVYMTVLIGFRLFASGLRERERRNRRSIGA
ncbi:MAG: ABC transporter permease subunit [Spirochaetia bacterium]|nr:ABC transporter permease subunit [Spirochaetia bacterium]